MFEKRLPQNISSPVQLPKSFSAALSHSFPPAISNQISNTIFTTRICRHGHADIYPLTQKHQNKHLRKSGKKKKPKPKVFGPDIFGWGGGLPREVVGAKKFGMSLETQESQTFWWISRGCPKSLRKKRLCSIFGP